jgi:cobaltochelatase CobS
MTNVTTTEKQQPSSQDIMGMDVQALTELYQSNTDQLVRAKINALPLWAEVEMKAAKKVFAPYWNGPDIKVPVRKHRHPDCDAAPFTYIPDGELLLTTVMYVTGERHLSLGIYGETGTGKSEMPRYVSDKLNMPLLAVSLTPTSREDKLFGTMMIEDGETYFQYGVVPRAYDADSLGYLLVINEIDKGCDSVIAKLHDVTDYKPVTVEDTGAVFMPHPATRVLVTGQTAGCGDPSGRYNVDKLDRAFAARFMWEEAKYPSAEVLKDIIKNSFPRVDDNIITAMGRFYKLCTQALENAKLEERGQETKTLLGGEVETLSTPVSIRLMKGWANSLCLFGDYRTIRESYERTIGLSAEEEDRDGLMILLEACFGEGMLDNPPVLLDVPETSTEEDAPIEYPESEPMDVNNVKFTAFAAIEEGTQRKKVWAIAADERGSFTIYTHPEKDGEFMFYHKPLEDFDGDIGNLKEYCQGKAKEKIDEKGYKPLPYQLKFDSSTKTIKRAA